jgi:1-acyl-sn-glycerol-3-phosphate acyltransferase
VLRFGMRRHAEAIAFGLRWIVGARIEVRGLEHAPAGSAVIAAKHQGMIDTIAPFGFLSDPCFVMKRELSRLPLYGWIAWKADSIVVDREAGAAALRRLVVDARDRLADGRQIVIFPEGTRQRPGSPPDYKPGVAALYRELNGPCHLMATNSGACWAGGGTPFRPGVIVFEFLEPIPPGLKRGEFMRELERRLEAASSALPQDHVIPDSA